MKKGFSLLEIFLALGIITILMAIIIPSFRGVQEESKIAKAKTELAILQSAIETYFNNQGEYPTDEYDYQNHLIDNTGLINKEYYDPFRSGETVYEYKSYSASTGAKYYLVSSLGLNKEKNIDTAAEGGDIDLDQGVLNVPAESDDILVTNLKINN